MGLPIPKAPQPNVPALLAALARGDASVLPALRDAAPAEAERPAEDYVLAACLKADPDDPSAADAIRLLVALQAQTAGPAVARALAHPNAQVRDAAARAAGEFCYYPAVPRLRDLRTDAALEALEMMFQLKFYGSAWGHLTGRPRRVEGKRDWSEFDGFWKEEGEELLMPPLLPEECSADRPVDDFLRRLPGSHRLFERHGYRCVARCGHDLDECVAVTKESLADAARLHGKDIAPILADLAALAKEIQEAETPPAKTDEVEIAEEPPKP